MIDRVVRYHGARNVYVLFIHFTNNMVLLHLLGSFRAIRSAVKSMHYVMQYLEYFFCQTYGICVECNIYTVGYKLLLLSMAVSRMRSPQSSCVLRPICALLVDGTC